MTRLRWRNTHRLVPSRYPTVGLFDEVASADDLEAVYELEGWTNDRLAAEAGRLHIVPRDEWVLGRPMASVVMAAFCHPGPGGGRFNGPDLGAWYCARRIETAHAEVVHHRSGELAEIGVTDTVLDLREYLADFDVRAHDVRAGTAQTAPLYDKRDYTAPQRFARAVRETGGDAIAYRSVRDGGECLAALRPPVVRNVRQGRHFRYHFEGTLTPRIVELGARRD